MPDIKLIHLEKNNYRVPTLKRHKSIGIDTEFMREKTFFAQLCLIQIATKKKIFIKYLTNKLLLIVSYVS